MYSTKRHLILLFFIWCFARFFTMFFGGDLLTLKGVSRKLSEDKLDYSQRAWIIEQRYNIARLIIDAADFDDLDIPQHYDQLISKKSIVEIIDYLEEIDHSLIRTIYINLKSSLQHNKIENIMVGLSPDKARELRQEVCQAFKQYLTPSDSVKIFKKRHCEIQ